MILVVDNYDSFVHNLARHVRLAGAETRVLRNDALDLVAIEREPPAGVVLSPGPGRPAGAGASLDLLSVLPAQTPALGVCLGCQCLAEAFGGRTVRARRPMHGRASAIRHDGRGLFAGLPETFEAGRYHSLCVEIPEDGPLQACAWSPEGEVMGLRHRTRPLHGVQFHPESLLTPTGRAMVSAFVRLTRERP